MTIRKKPRKESFTIYLTREVRELLEKKARQNNRSLNSFISIDLEERHSR